MTGGRANPFDDTDIDLSDFKKQPAARPKVPAQAVREMSEKHNFPSRAAIPASPPAQQRRRRTGRSQQLNLKVKAETAVRFAELADAQRWGFGEAFEQALMALEEKLRSAKHSE